MTITILGGSGFVGMRLLAQLSQKDHVLRNVDTLTGGEFSEISSVGDICDPPSFDEKIKGADTVVLLAAEHRDDVSPVSRYYDVNVQGTKNVLEAMDQHGVRNLVFTSSVAIYGMDRANPPSEGDPAEPFNHYGKSKWEAEEHIRAWMAKGDGRNALIIRPTVIFGENNRGNVFNLLSQIFGGRFIMIGDGKNRKSMAYVGNIVAFIDHMLSRGISGLEIFNYVDKPDLDMNTLVDLVYAFKKVEPPRRRLPRWIGMGGGYCCDAIAFLTRRKLPVSSIRVKKFCATTQIAADKIEETGFKRPFTLEGALERTLQNEFGDTTASAEAD